jgi:hypothetical protein
VVTAGASTSPIHEYYEEPWQSVDSAEQLQAICSQGRTVWVVTTFPRYLQDWRPALAAVIREKFEIIRVFPGTVGDGDIYVARFQPR